VALRADASAPDEFPAKPKFRRWFSSVIHFWCLCPKFKKKFEEKEFYA
jgi:hypothetical protein